ncbi:DUF2635 domain-containing protein [Parvibaculum sp.]|uniref:DUF2635 domain-containing protein n=1 Tax=Parvibaculum sp. TaxID=2024848 RepID=UPI00272F3965|nr:DUF2635 domain-containing protein [Parvibaculum sp.]MDP1628857.1 DUF2635 domain-containing protein [Parvibaculum sp.]MDP2148252.1 DUF2635 domain-containing protein [Parvibaculum sp.]MDP3327864.1 DUF2635 domain-containing protein [Parvibaculum sp.]
MDKKLYGRPAPGLKVRDPDHDNRHVPATDAEYPRTPYWAGRFRDGDMIASVAPASAKPAAKTSSAAGKPAA